MRFKNKTVLITGAASGIGRATALCFAKQGANVVVSDVNSEGGNETVKMIQDEDGEAFFIAADVSDYEAVENLVEGCLKQYNALDIAVNNAGIGGKTMAPVAQYAPENWDKVIAVNQTGVFYCMQKELQHMEKQGHGCIINVASLAGLKGLANGCAYTASKHAVIGITKAAALEYAEHNIRINAVCPVFTHSAMLQNLLDTVPGIDEKLKKRIPMNRFGEAEEIAEAISWLSSAESGFVTGIAMPLDGGSMA